MADSHLTELSFTGLHLPELLQKGLADAGFERCTPIQAQTLPHALAGMDVAGQAQAGTGWTQIECATRRHPGADARTGGANSQRRRTAGPAHRAAVGTRVWRQRF